MRALFLINERSGTGRGGDVSEVIRHAAGGWSIELVRCGRKEDLDGIIDRAEEEEVDVVFAVGGDGTVHEAGKRLIGRRPALGVLPIGSGNGFARHIGLALDPAAALRSCCGGRIEAIDTAQVNGLPFLGVMGVGFDAEVARRFATSTVRGLGTYVKEGLGAFFSYRPEEYEIAIGGETLRRRAFVVAVANSGQYGNGARIAPLASVRDGLLDVVIVEDVSAFRAPLLLGRLFSGSFHRSRGVESLEVAELTIRRSSEGPAHLDGEPVVLPDTLRIRVRPRSLRVLVPDGATAI